MDQKIRDRAIRVLEIARGMAEKLDEKHGSYSASNRLEDIRLHFCGYAEPGYHVESGIVATGNWNSFRVWDRKTNTHTHECYIPERLRKIFEKLGIDCQWSDEWTECTQCYAVIRTRADSYGWLPSYMRVEGEPVCRECVAKHAADYLQGLEDNPDTALTLRNVDPTAHGYRKLDEVYENGWHPGQNDDPHKVAAELRNKGISRFLFRITDTGQFDTRFVVYVHEDEYTLLNATHDDSFPESTSYAEDE